MTHRMAIHLHVAACTDIGQVRKKNEDAFLAADFTRRESSSGAAYRTRCSVGARGVLLAVSDGMGGAACGEVASALVLSSLAQSLAEQDPGPAPSQAVARAVEDAHRAVWDQAGRQGIEMGATLTAAYVLDDTAYIAEVGDSRAYLLRAGRFTQLTKDQSYVQMLVDMGKVPAEEAMTLPLRNVILQAMGIQPHVKAALGRLELRSRDCLLLCSDGLTTKLADETIRDTILGSPHLEAAASRLVAMANERGGEDNVTVVLAGVGGSLPAPRPSEPPERTYAILESFEAEAPAADRARPRGGTPTNR
jgi:serine/threonine protein phosphatase PrpC